MIAVIPTFLVSTVLYISLITDTNAYVNLLGGRIVGRLTQFSIFKSEFCIEPNAHKVSMSQDIEGFDSISMGEVTAIPSIKLLPMREPYVSIEEAPSNSRRIFTGVDIMADMESIWNVLTAFDSLQEVVPSLISSEVVFRTPEGGARLAQVGGAKVLPGVTFTARTVLDVMVFKENNPMPDSMLTNRADKMPILVRGVFPCPDSIVTLPHRDIAIQNVLGEGDFEHYQGVWRMQALPNCAPDGSNASRLTYAVEIKPKGLLPVKLIEGRIAADLKANLAAIRDYVEKNAQKLLEDLSTSEEKESTMVVMPSIETTAVADSLDVPAESDFTVQELEMSTVFAATPIPVTFDLIGSTEIIDSSDVNEDSSDALIDIMQSAPSPAAPAILISTSYRQQLAFENEKIQRAVAALEKDLGSALSKIQQIRLLSKTLLDTETASA